MSIAINYDRLAYQLVSPVSHHPDNDDISNSCPLHTKYIKSTGFTPHGLGAVNDVGNEHSIEKNVTLPFPCLWVQCMVF